MNGLWASWERAATPDATCGAPWARWTPTPTRSREAISQNVLAEVADRDERKHGVILSRILRR
jgi:hypothetical protein